MITSILIALIFCINTTKSCVSPTESAESDTSFRDTIAMANLAILRYSNLVITPTLLLREELIKKPIFSQSELNLHSIALRSAQTMMQDCILKTARIVAYLSPVDSAQEEELSALHSLLEAHQDLWNCLERDILIRLYGPQLGLCRSETSSVTQSQHISCS